MLAVDISGSMSEVDMTINSNAASRIEVLKVVAEKFIDRRQGDRLGLILFGTNAYTYVPLTFDLETLKKTAPGRHYRAGWTPYCYRGCDRALRSRTMREQNTAHKVLILVTDGSNTAGFENPIVARTGRTSTGADYIYHWRRHRRRNPESNLWPTKHTCRNCSQRKDAQPDCRGHQGSIFPCYQYFGTGKYLPGPR